MSEQERTRYFQYMRPRYANPSFASSNVYASMGQTYQPVTDRPIRSMSNSDFPKNYKTEMPQSSQKQEQMPKTPLSRSKSQLSNIGTSSLSSLPKFVNERDIYQKQQKKYNIITIQPKQYNETIKKYPKYRLQDIDLNYYKKLKLQDQYNQSNLQRELKIRRQQNPQTVSNLKYGNSLPMWDVKIEEIGKSFRPKLLNNIDELSGML